MKLARFKNYFQVSVSAGFLDGDDLIVYESMVPRQETASGDYHVDFVGSVPHGSLGLADSGVQGVLSARKGGGYGGYGDARAFQFPSGDLYERRVYTNGSHLGEFRHFSV